MKEATVKQGYVVVKKPYKKKVHILNAADEVIYEEDMAKIDKRVLGPKEQQIFNLISNEKA